MILEGKAAQGGKEQKNLIKNRFPESHNQHFQ